MFWKMRIAENPSQLIPSNLEAAGNATNTEDVISSYGEIRHAAYQKITYKAACDKSPKPV